MRKNSLFALLLLAPFADCSCNHAASNMFDAAVNTLIIDPGEVTLDLAQGQPPPSQTFRAFFHDASGDKDVTADTMFMLSDERVGTMSGATFTAATTQGGTTTLTGTYKGHMGTATIHVRVRADFKAPDCSTCPTFPTDTAPTCAAGVADAPSVVYPVDGILVPPNMNVISVQFMPGTNNKHFEVDFQNANTDVRVITSCMTQVVDTKNNDTGGCDLELDPMMWKFIAGSNRGGDGVKITVRATPDDTCVTASTANINISFAEEDLEGGIYYWKSTISPNGTGGHIWSKSFGDSAAAVQVTSNALGAACFGCHTLSRDGKKMFVNHDDDDSDDEYGDVNSDLINLETKMFVAGGFANRPPGFQTFNPDHSLAIATNGDGSDSPIESMYLWDGNTSMNATPAKFNAAPSGKRPTQPDWAPDGKNVVFVVPTYLSWNSGTVHTDDDHFTAGSLYTIPYNGNNQFGTASELIHSAGENNYYPGYSPDGAFIIFNRVEKQSTDLANDAFSNPKARVWILPTKSGATATDCANLNATGDLSNSWPRWSPFIQKYKGTRLLWVTFSSTRDYGLFVRNSFGSQIQCYPNDTPQDPTHNHHQVFAANCKQPQLWMAAINLDKAEIPAQDPSFPAFWLPFQDVTTHNHTAQWTQTVVSQPPMDGGTCIDNGQSCAANPNNCCSGICTASGTCGIP